jgi:hypothetical protein
MTRELATRTMYSQRTADTPALTLALIPAHNEERFIGSMVLAVRAYVDEVVVIDDGSADRTSEVARQAGATVLQHRRNGGKAAAVNTGFVYARALHPSAVVMLDGDGQHCADDIPQVLAPITSGRADVVVGSRFLGIKSDIPAYRQVGQHGLTFVTNLASGVRVSDSQSGFRAFSGRAVQHLTFTQGGFSIESEMQFLVKEHRLRVTEAPIKVIYAEKAKRNPVRHGLQVLNGVLRLMTQLRPMQFFGTTGFAVFMVGAMLGVYLTQIYAATQQLAIGYGLLTVLLCVVGLVLFAGIILHSTRAMIRNVRYSMLDSQQAEPASVADLLRPHRAVAEPRLDISPALVERAVGA